MPSRKPPSQRNPEYAVARMSRALQSMSPGTMSGRLANAGPINFKSVGQTSLLSGAGVGGGSTTLPTRQVATIVTASLAAGEIMQGNVDMSTHYRIMYVKTSVPARVRLYIAVADRDRDKDRPITFDPYPGLGIVMDYLTADILLEAPLSPMAEGAIFSASQANLVPYNVTSINGGPVTVTLTWIALE